LVGTVSVRNLEFQGRHGATAAERRTLRRFQVDVDIESSLDAAIASDRLVDAVNYYEVCEIVLEIGTGKPFHLIEALAGALVAALAERWPRVTLTVEVRKLNPPCPGNPQWTAVRLTRRAAT
jgi:dihydroneopterin aldolase